MSVAAVVELLTTAEAAAESRRHPTTIRKALEAGAKRRAQSKPAQAGDLHGEQRVPGGRWFIERECLHAYSKGKLCPHAEQRPPIQLRRP